MKVLMISHEYYPKGMNATYLTKDDARIIVSKINGFFNGGDFVKNFRETGNIGNFYMGELDFRGK